VLQHSEIRIHKPVNTILQTALLLPVHPPGGYPTRHALFPADVRQAVHGCIAMSAHVGVEKGKGKKGEKIKIKIKTNTVEFWPFAIR
jgi:hypothetical protein